MADLSTMSDAELEAALRAKLTAAPEQPKDRSFIRGVLAGAKEPVDRLAQRANRAVNLDRLSRLLGMPTADEAARGGDAARARNTSTVGQGVGNMIGMAPTMALKAPAAAVGALEGAILSDERSLGGVATDALWGAGGAYVGDKAVRGLANVVSPRISKAVQRLTKEGIPLTPGEIVGGRLRNWEDKLMSVGIIGDAISASRQRGQRQLERVAVNKALRNIGEALPDDKAGREAVAYAGEKIGQHYGRVVPRLGAQIDRTFATRVNATRQRLNLPPAQAAQFDDIIQREIGSTFDPQTGRISGRAMKDLDERLGDLAAAWGKSDDPFQRRLADGMGDVRKHLIGMLSRQSPQAAKDLRAVNRAYANLVPLENAVNVVDGSVTSGRLYQGVKAADRSVRKRATTRARNEMARLALDAAETMGSKVPNSGTADRLLAAGAIGGPIAGGAAVLGPAVATPLAAAIPYLPGASRLTQRLMTGRQGKIPKAAADYIRKAAPYAALGVPPFLVNPAYAEESE